ncbi:MAG TPA: LapA family protein [Acidimicrobiales bacterium]|jgi:uncharacterized integral membrane protein|nr:LapA family protein [Acidimicrobiales bacterium]
MSTQPTPEPQPQPQQTPAEKPGLGGGAIASLIGAGALLTFMLQNRQDVRVHFFFWNVTWPLWFVVLGSALLGAVVWLGFGVLRRHRRRKARRAARRD